MLVYTFKQKNKSVIECYDHFSCTPTNCDSIRRIICTPRAQKWSVYERPTRGVSFLTNNPSKGGSPLPSTSLCSAPPLIQARFCLTGTHPATAATIFCQHPVMSIIKKKKGRKVLKLMSIPSWRPIRIRLRYYCSLFYFAIVLFVSSRPIYSLTDIFILSPGEIYPLIESYFPSWWQRIKMRCYSFLIQSYPFYTPR